MTGVDGRDIDLDTIFQAIHEELSNIKKTDVQLTISRRIDKPMSTITFFTASGSDGTKNYILKKPVPSEWDKSNKAEQAKTEYDALNILYPRFESIEGCSVPRPILFLPEHNAMVMKAYDYSLLQERMRYCRYFTSRNSFESLRKSYRTAGIWLKKIMEIYGINKYKSEVLYPLVEDCELRIKKIIDSKPLELPYDFVDHLTGQLKELVSRLDREEIPFTRVHGDFGPWNILHSSQDIKIIDFSTFGDGSLCTDVVKMLLSLADRLNSPFQNKRRILLLMDEFMQGYGVKPKVNENLYVICEFQLRLVSLCGAIFPDPAWNRPFIRKAVAKSHMKWFYNDRNRKYLWQFPDIL